MSTITCVTNKNYFLTFERIKDYKKWFFDLFKLSMVDLHLSNNFTQVLKR